MNLPYEFILFGVAFFGFMAVVNAIQAHRKKEKVYYFSAMVSFVMVLAVILVFLNQFILAFFVIIVTGVFSAAGLPKLLRIQKRELAKLLQKGDLSTPLRVRDFFTNIGWLKLAYRWGLKKYLLFMWFFMMLSIGGLSLALNLWLKFLSIGFIVTYTVISSVGFTIMSYATLKSNLEKKGYGAVHAQIFLKDTRVNYVVIPLIAVNRSDKRDQ